MFKSHIHFFYPKKVDNFFLELSHDINASNWGEEQGSLVVVDKLDGRGLEHPERALGIVVVVGGAPAGLERPPPEDSSSGLDPDLDDPPTGTLACPLPGCLKVVCGQSGLKLSASYILGDHRADGWGGGIIGYPEFVW